MLSSRPVSSPGVAAVLARIFDAASGEDVVIDGVAADERRHYAYTKDIAVGVAQAIANLLYCWLAFAGKDYALMTTAITVDHLMNGMGTAAFVAFLMTLCDKRFTAMQYAIFSSLMTVPGRVLGGFSGFLQESVGWPGFFLTTIVLAAPAVLLLSVVRIREPDPAEPRGDGSLMDGLFLGLAGGFLALLLTHFAEAGSRTRRGTLAGALLQVALGACLVYLAVRA